MAERDDAVAWLQQKRIDFSQGTNTAAQRHVATLLEMIDELVETSEQHMRVMDELEVMMLAAGLVSPGDAVTPKVHLLRMFLPS